MQLRLAFKKTGMIKFISHLDTIRVFNRAIQRTHIPILWSEGFNPHQKLSIAQPLSVGMESEFEVMDMEVEDGSDPEAVKKTLNRALPSGLEIIEVTADFDPKAVFERIAKTEYRFFFPSTHYEDAAALKMSADKAMAQDVILVRRRKKKGKRRVIVEEDIKDGIFSLRWEEEAQGAALYAILRAGANGNLRPDRFLTGLFASAGADIDYIQIRRIKSWDGDDHEVRF
ncbi:MAG: TIGR03936 family radical SAM-associated protein [Peptoniphilus sp.]|nr:TIGR03936 family radical SAM-associated protein [Peptoniphilus sp.]MDY3118548.1 TIGR03936 family radical SAM-associated protein [Peptoniphilus sp.]